MQKQIKTTRWPIALLILIAISACHNFYKARPARTGANTSTTVDSLNRQARYFVLRNGAEAFYMNNIVLSSDRKSLTCTLDTLSPQHRLHLKKGHKGNLQYKKNNPLDLNVLNEVHIYVTDLGTVAAGENLGLPLDKVQKIEVIEKDNGRTTGSYVIGAVGYTLGAMAVVAIIAAALKSSCPFVSAYDGKEFVLQGEIYGGAIYPQLARHDYLPLKMATSVDGLQLKISNELKEKQYTDFANLLVITHDARTRVLSDENGSLYSISSPQTPVTATLNGRKNVLPALLKANDDAIAYMDDTATANAGNTIALKFKKGAGASKAKLVLTLKNAYWLDLLYGELAKGFGSYYGTYMKQQANKPAAELIKWTKDQQMPLSVSIQTKKGQQQVSDITTIGPLANRTIVVPLDLRGVDENEIEINLSAGFMFWEIDYAGLDFSADDNYSVEKLTPQSATDETGKDVLASLQKEDGIYLEQPEIGNVATISYHSTSLPDASKTRSFILQTKGWYQHIRNFTNAPNVSFLQRFLKPNALPVYGKELYKQIQAESLRMMAGK